LLLYLYIIYMILFYSRKLCISTIEIKTIFVRRYIPSDGGDDHDDDGDDESNPKKDGKELIGFL
jgi:hypothetical protein